MPARVILVLLSLLACAAAVAQSGLWLPHKGTNARTSQPLTMSVQMHPATKSGFGLICDSGTFKLAFLHARPAPPGKLSYRVDRGAWQEGGWTLQDKRFVAEGDVARSLLNRFLQARDSIAFRADDGPEATFFTADLLTVAATIMVDCQAKP